MVKINNLTIMKPGGMMFSHLPRDFWVFFFFPFLMSFLVSPTLSLLTFPNLDSLKGWNLHFILKIWFPTWWGIRRVFAWQSLSIIYQRFCFPKRILCFKTFSWLWSWADGSPAARGGHTKHCLYPAGQISILPKMKPFLHCPSLL